MSLSNHPEWDRLLLGCQKNDAQLVKQLLLPEEEGGAGISANHANAIGQSALHIASWWAHVDCTALLLEHNASVDATNTLTNATPLHCACLSNRAIGTPRRLETIKMLLETGSNPEALDKDGKRPIDLVDTTDPDLTEIKKLFLSTTIVIAEKFYYQSPSQEQPIFQAVKEKSLDLLESSLSSLAYSLSSSTNKSVRYDQRTPLQLLVTKWCEIDQVDPFFSNAMSIFVGKVSQYQDTSNDRISNMTCYLEEVGSASFCVDLLCDSILHLYKQRKSIDDPLIAGWISAVNTLLTFLPATTDIADINSLSSSAWLEIARRNYLDLARLWWCQFHINPTTVVGRQGMTPLHFAARSGKLEMVEFFLKIYPRVSIHAQNQLGQTPLQAALVNGHESVSKLLQGFAIQE
jgi:hypothetical protein